jgi:nucleoside-diphosphate-sugar epimerase
MLRNSVTKFQRREDLMAAILVNGGAGYIGSRTCSKGLRRFGFDQITYDNHARGCMF